VSICKRYTKDGTFHHEASVWHKGNFIKSKTFHRRVDAAEWRLRERQKLLDSTVGRLQGRGMTFDEFFQTIYHQRKELRLGTKRDYEAMYKNYIAEAFGKRRLDEISDQEFSQLLHQLKKRLSGSRANRIRTFLSSVYSLAVKLKYLIVNPIYFVEPFEEPLKTTEYWSIEEAREFLNWTRKNSPRFVLYHFAYETGLRRGEIQAIKRDSIDLTANVITVRSTYSYHSKGITDSTKGGKLRHVGISSNLKESLREQLNSHRHEIVFCDEYGKPFTGDHIRYHFAKDCRLAGVRKIRFHSFSRHTFASHFVMNGGHIYDLQKILGHADVSTTDRYAHLDQDYLKSRAGLVTFNPTASRDSQGISI